MRKVWGFVGEGIRLWKLVGGGVEMIVLKG